MVIRVSLGKVITHSDGKTSQYRGIIRTRTQTCVRKRGDTNDKPTGKVGIATYRNWG